MKIKELLKLNKGKIFFFVLGCIFALAWEQQGWWNLILFNHGEFHNDWWIIISEDIKSWEDGGNLNVLYSAKTQQALLSYNIWSIILTIASILILLSILISIYTRVKK
jgi:hypothetical protein